MPSKKPQPGGGTAGSPKPNARSPAPPKNKNKNNHSRAPTTAPQPFPSTNPVSAPSSANHLSSLSGPPTPTPSKKRIRHDTRNRGSRKRPNNNPGDLAADGGASASAVAPAVVTPCARPASIAPAVVADSSAPVSAASRPSAALSPNSLAEAQNTVESLLQINHRLRAEVGQLQDRVEVQDRFVRLHMHALPVREDRFCQPEVDALVSRYAALCRVSQQRLAEMKPQDPRYAFWEYAHTLNVTTYDLVTESFLYRGFAVSGDLREHDQPQTMSLLLPAPSSTTATSS